jgi:hypothetical protein
MSGRPDGAAAGEAVVDGEPEPEKDSLEIEKNLPPGEKSPAGRRAGEAIDQY